MSLKGMGITALDNNQKGRRSTCAGVFRGALMSCMKPTASFYFCWKTKQQMDRNWTAALQAGLSPMAQYSWRQQKRNPTWQPRFPQPFLPTCGTVQLTVAQHNLFGVVPRDVRGSEHSPMQHGRWLGLRKGDGDPDNTGVRRCSDSRLYSVAEAGWEPARSGRY